MSERTMITSPTGDVNKGHSGQVTGAASGAAMGAAAGSMVMPGIGTAVGAVVGAVAGLVAGGMRDSSEFYANKAQAWVTLGKDRDQSNQSRNYLREFRATRAAAIAGIGQEAGGTRSSAPMGSVSSLASQYSFGQNYMDSQVYIQRKSSKNLAKAKKFGAASQDLFAIMDAGFKAASAWGSVYGGGMESPANMQLRGTMSSGFTGGGRVTSYGAPAAPTYGPTPYAPQWGSGAGLIGR